ncbi:hypothetical protein SAMN05428949_0835 [Chitinophaga sp. YR627]|nr:hypothetical protein SAMN05428949_0835 [Chitinophaga sp. YR627]
MIRSLSVLLTIIITLSYFPATSCSMFKITLHGKTMAGNNEDAWKINSKIWFEKGVIGQYGAAYVGHSDLFPQGGINEAGLTFDGFTVYPRPLRSAAGKKKIDDKTAFMKMLLQRCGKVEEVQQLAYQYDRSVFNTGVFLFVDSTGKYLVMEADTLIVGNDEKYVISNFCPSTIKDPAEVKIGRYQRGQQFLSLHSDTTLAFCKAVMDTMHECRNKMGDGTTYTVIYDLKARMINLYFYHDFTHTVGFSLMDELKKGNHLLNIPDLFPPNHEYLNFVHFKTPFNSSFIKLFLYVLELLLVLLTVFWAIYLTGLLFSGKINIKTHYGMCLLLIMNIGLGVYLFILQNNQPLFYYDAPYYVSGKTVLDLTAYLPVVLLGLIIPVGLANIRAVNRPSVTKFTRRIFTLNTVIYLISLLLFAYWGLLFIVRG